MANKKIGAKDYVEKVNKFKAELEELGFQVCKEYEWFEIESSDKEKLEKLTKQLRLTYMHKVNWKLIPGPVDYWDVQIMECLPPKQGTYKIYWYADYGLHPTFDPTTIYNDSIKCAKEHDINLANYPWLTSLKDYIDYLRIQIDALLAGLAWYKVYNYNNEDEDI